MATKKETEVINLQDQITTVTPEKEAGYTGPMVSVFIPELEENVSGGMKVDQYEHVTIANEEKEEIYYVRRGERVDVPVPVYLALKVKYPKI